MQLEIKEKMIINGKTNNMRIDLPMHEDLPVFKGLPLIEIDDSGMLRFYKRAVLTLATYLTLIVKDVYRFT